MPRVPVSGVWRVARPPAAIANLTEGTTRTLIICDGNTCRSPTLQFLLFHLSNRLGRQDEFVSAGRASVAGNDDPMPVPGQAVLEKAVEWLDKKLGYDPLCSHDPHLLNLLYLARTHRSRRLDDSRIRGPFDELIFIAAPRSNKPVELLRQSRKDLDRLSVPLHGQWTLIRQGDGGFYALQQARSNGVRNPDHDPAVINAYLKQAISLAGEALNYYHFFLPGGRQI